MADPQLEAVLGTLKQIFAGQEGPPGIAALREGARAMARQFDHREIPVGRIENRMVAGAEGEIRARIYTPVAAGASTQPALVFFHGGGFVCGDLDTHDTLCRGLAAASHCRIVAIDYRLAPEHPFPAAIDDALAALRWVEANATAIGVDPNRIAVGGESAGGNIAAVCCQEAKRLGAPALQFQLLLYPVTQCGEDTPSRQRFAEDFLASREMRLLINKLYFGESVPGSDPRAAPLMADDFSGLPPAYILTAGLDPVQDEGRQYAERLREAGVRVEHVHYDDMIHGFLTMSAVLDTAKLAVERAGEALRAALA